MKSKAFGTMIAGLSLLAAASLGAQILKPGADQAEILSKGLIVSKNIEGAIAAHLADDGTFGSKKQLPEDNLVEPKILKLKDGFLFDWTSGQEARHLMEELRQGIHALQSADKPRGFDVIALTGAREVWPRLRDISCHETPGIQYYDLDGFEQYCPTK